MKRERENAQKTNKRKKQKKTTKKYDSINQVIRHYFPM